MKQYTMIISGRVQGVGFRFSARENARKYNLKGYVMNKPNGDVKIVAEGPEEALESYLSWCRQGPAHAMVDNVSVQKSNEVSNFKHFDIKR